MIRAHAVCNYRQISGLLYKDPNWFNRINNRTRAASTDKTWATWGPSKAVIMWQRFCFVFCVLFFVFYFRFCFGQKRWETHLRMWRKKSVNKLWENEADFNQTRAFFIWTFSQFSFILCVCVCVCVKNKVVWRRVSGVSKLRRWWFRRRSTETQLESFWELPIENSARIVVVFLFLLYKYITYAAKFVPDCKPKQNSYIKC